MSDRALVDEALAALSTDFARLYSTGIPRSCRPITGPDGAPPDDRDLEVTAICPINIDAQIDAVGEALGAA